MDDGTASKATAPLAALVGCPRQNEILACFNVAEKQIYHHGAPLGCVQCRACSAPPIAKCTVKGAISGGLQNTGNNLIRTGRPLESLLPVYLILLSCVRHNNRAIARSGALQIVKVGHHVSCKATFSSHTWCRDFLKRKVARLLPKRSQAWYSIFLSLQLRQAFYKCPCCQSCSLLHRCRTNPRYPSCKTHITLLHACVCDSLS